MPRGRLKPITHEATYTPSRQSGPLTAAINTSTPIIRPNAYPHAYASGLAERAARSLCTIARPTVMITCALCPRNPRRIKPSTHRSSAASPANETLASGLAACPYSSARTGIGGGDIDVEFGPVGSGGGGGGGVAPVYSGWYSGSIAARAADIGRSHASHRTPCAAAAPSTCRRSPQFRQETAIVMGYPARKTYPPG